jgi:RNA polymerase sigma-54 factor
MSLLSPRLDLKVAQKQILTPGLVQMVTVLQLNRLELKEMITQEIVKNPVLEEATEEGEEVTPEELLPLLDPARWMAMREMWPSTGASLRTPKRPPPR